MKLFGTLRELVAAVFRKDGHEITLRPNQTSSLYTTNRAVSLPQVDNDVVLTASGYIANADIAAAAGIVDSKLATISTAGKVSNSATTATDANTASAIVARDASGNFSAGTITANLTGNVSGSAASFTGSLSGEVTGTQSATVVADDVIDNANIKSTAAIAYSKLALTGSILNADLAGSIDAAKISSGSVSNTEFDYLNGVTSSIQTQFSGKAASGANSDITSLSGLTTALSIGQGGTGQTTASDAINALLPSQTTNFNKYLKTDGTNVSWASASGGAGEINAVLNSSGADGISGWVNGTSHTINTVTGATIPLSPAVPTAFTMSSSAAIAIGSQTSSSGDYYEFTMPPGLRNRKLKFEFYYTTPAAADGTWGVAVYNGATKVRLSTDTGATPDTVLPAGVAGGKFTAYFDTDAGTTYRVNFVQRTRTNANALWVTSVIVGPGIQPQGAVVGEWQSYTPASGLTNATHTGRYRRVGSNIELRIDIAFSGAPAGSFSFTQSNYLNGLNLTVDSTALPNTTDTVINAGSWAALDSGVNDRYGGLVNLAPGATNSLSPVSSAGVPVSPTAPFTFGAGDNYSLWLTLPIAEWAGSGTVQLAQNDVEYASNGDTSAADNTANFVYGPNGSAIPSITATTGAPFLYLKRVSFTSPIQAGDRLSVEIQLAGTGPWIPLENLPGHYQSLRLDNATGNRWGIGLQQFAGANTVDVIFGLAGRLNSGWAGGAGPNYPSNAADRYRVRKSSAGAAVGFGIVQPGVSSGLVSASGLPGNTTGSAIASGYVGEIVSASPGSAVTPGASVASGINKTVTSISLSPGIWDVQGVVQFATGATLAGMTIMYSGISLTDNSNDIANNLAVTGIATNNTVSANFFLPCGPRRLTLTSTTTVYLVAGFNYTTLGGTTYGTNSTIRATRIA